MIEFIASPEGSAAVTFFTVSSIGWVVTKLKTKPNSTPSSKKRKHADEGKHSKKDKQASSPKAQKKIKSTTSEKDVVDPRLEDRSKPPIVNSKELASKRQGSPKAVPASQPDEGSNVAPIQGSPVTPPTPTKKTSLKPPGS